MTRLVTELEDQVKHWRQIQDLRRYCDALEVIMAARLDDGSLVDVISILTNDAYRRKVLGGVSDPLIIAPWAAGFDQLSEPERARVVMPVLNKLRAFLNRAPIRNKHCQIDDCYRRCRNTQNATEVPQMATDDAPPTPVSFAELRRKFVPCLVLIPVLVGLFVQKSDGNSALETLIYLGLAVTSVLAIWSAPVAIRMRSRPHNHVFSWYFHQLWVSVMSATIGCIILIVALIVIDREDTDVDVPPSTNDTQVQRPSPRTANQTPSRVDTQATIDSDAIALRNMQVSSNDTTIRIVSTVLNTTQSLALADSVQVSIHTAVPAYCSPAYPSDDFSVPVYRLDDQVLVKNGKLADGKASVDGGPLDGFKIPVEGNVDWDCGATMFEIQFRTDITLAPSTSTYFVFDLPRRITMRIIDVKKVDVDGNDVFDGEDTPVIGSKKDETIPSIPPESEPYSAEIEVRIGHSSNSEWACLGRSYVFEFHRLSLNPCK